MGSMRTISEFKQDKFKKEIERITKKLENNESLTENETTFGISLLFNLIFESNREEWAKSLAFHNGRWNQDVYDDFMKDEKDEKLIKITIPNPFTYRKRYEEWLAYQKRCIVYVCPHCKAKISRQPESRKDCPLCKAPYNYEKEEVFKQLKKQKEVI